MCEENKFRELDNRKIGQRIRLQRESMHLSREELASEIDISPRFLKDIENGEKGMSMQTLYKMMQHLNISADFLMESSFSVITEEAKEIMQIKENILAPLSVCNVQQLKCMEQIVKYYIEAIMLHDGMD